MALPPEPTAPGEGPGEGSAPHAGGAMRPVERQLAVHTTPDGAPAPAPYVDEYEREQAERARRLQARFARKPWVTWALIGSICAMFAAQGILGGLEDPYVLIRLGGQVPERVLDGQWWRLISSAFLHAGVMHFALNTYVLYVVGNTLERIVGSARFLLAYTFSVLAASAASMVFSDASLTVGASGGVFGLFGVEAVVVFMRPDLLPEELRAKHARSVVINLLINVANSFRPHIAMAAHFGGGVAGALAGLVLVPHRLDEDRGGEPAWARAGAALSGLLLVAGVGLALHDAFAGSAAGPPTLARMPIHLGDVRASAEVPAGLPIVADQPGVFGELGDDPVVVAFRFADDLAGYSPAQLASEMDELGAPEGMAFGRREEATLAGRPAMVAYYIGDAVPLTLERVLLRAPTSAWIVEVAFWSAAEGAYGGLARRVAESIVEEPPAMGEPIELSCGRWSARLPPGASVRPLVWGPRGEGLCGDPGSEVAMESRGVARMRSHFEVVVDGCALDVRTEDALASELPPERLVAPPEGERFAFEVGDIQGTPALRAISSDAALLVLVSPTQDDCEGAVRQLRRTIQRSLEEAPLAEGGAVHVPLAGDGSALELTLPQGWVVLSRGAPPLVLGQRAEYETAYDLQTPDGRARAVWVTDRLDEPVRVASTTLLSDRPRWETVREPDGARTGTCALTQSFPERDLRLALYLCGAEEARAAVLEVLATGRFTPPTASDAAAPASR
jgi:membrane associated rhomboid family serine protease